MYLLNKSICLMFILISLLYMLFLVDKTVANEPIAIIGEPLPIKHAFLSNKTFLRVVPNYIQIVDVNTGEVEGIFAELTYDSDVIFSQDSTHIAILNYVREMGKTNIEIWDVNVKEKISEWDVEFRLVDIAAFNNIDPLIAFTYDNQIHLWNWQSGEFVGTMVGERRNWERCNQFETTNGIGRWCISTPDDHDFEFTPDGESLIVASTRPDIEIWDLKTRNLVGHFEGHESSWVDGVEISPNGSILASFERYTNHIYVWDIETRDLLWKEKSGDGLISEMTFSPDSQFLFVTTQTDGVTKLGWNPWEGWDDKIRLWDVKSGKQIDTYTTEFRDLMHIAFSPDGKRAIINYSDAEVLYDLEKKQILKVWNNFLRHWYDNTVNLSPDGETVVSVSHHYIKSWDVDTQEMFAFESAKDYKFDMWGVDISPDSQTIAVGKDPWVELRDIKTGRIQKQFSHYISGMRQIEYSQTGRWLGVIDDFRRLIILDINNPVDIERVNIKVDSVSPGFQQIAFSVNDKYLATSCETVNENERKYWVLLFTRDINTFKFQFKLSIPSRLYARPDFTINENGLTVLSLPIQGEIQLLYIINDGIQLFTALKAYENGPVKFSPDGKYIFTNNDDSFQIWDWQKRKQIKHSFYPSFVSLSKDCTKLLSQDFEATEQFQVWDISQLISFFPYDIQSQDKKFVTLGQIKRNQLLQNFPNPFNPETWIPFRLADKRTVTIRIYTPTGNLVRTLSPGVMAAGDYSSQSKAVHWDGRNEKGEMVSSGIYLYTINAGNYSDTRKMIIKK